MSVYATRALRPLLREIRGLLAALPDKHRPDHRTAQLVALHLADEYRDGRAYVDSTVDQIADALDLSNGQIRDALAALEQIGVWRVVPGARGSKGRGSKREPGRLLAPLLAAAIADPFTTPTRAVDNAAGRQYSAGLTPRSTPRGQPRDSPIKNPYENIASSSRSVELGDGPGSDDDMAYLQTRSIVVGMLVDRNAPRNRAAYATQIERNMTAADVDRLKRCAAHCVTPAIAAHYWLSGADPVRRDASG